MKLRDKIRTTLGIGFLGAGAFGFWANSGTGSADSVTSYLGLGVERSKVNCETFPKTNKWDSTETRCDFLKRDVEAYDLPNWHPASHVSESVREGIGYLTGPLTEVALGAGLLLGPGYLARKREEEE